MSEPRPPTTPRRILGFLESYDAKFIAVSCDPPNDWGTGANRRYGRKLADQRMDDIGETSWQLPVPPDLAVGVSVDHQVCSITDDGESEWEICVLEIPDPEL